MILIKQKYSKKVKFYKYASFFCQYKYVFVIIILSIWTTILMEKFYQKFHNILIRLILVTFSHIMRNLIKKW